MHKGSAPLAAATTAPERTPPHRLMGAPTSTSTLLGLEAPRFAEVLDLLAGLPRASGRHRKVGCLLHCGVFRQEVGPLGAPTPPKVADLHAQPAAAPVSSGGDKQEQSGPAAHTPNPKSVEQAPRLHDLGQHLPVKNSWFPFGPIQVPAETKTE